MAVTSSAQQHLLAPPTLQRLPAPSTQQYLPMSVYPQYLMAPPTRPTTPSMPQSGLFRPTQATAPSAPPVPGAYAMPCVDGRDRGDVVTGIISVDSFDAHALFDSGASFSFVSEGFVVRASLSMQKISQSIVVSSARGLISSSSVCPGCAIHLADETFVANLVVIPLDPFDVILGMDWLSQYRAVISCFWKTVSLQAPSGREVVFQGSAVKYALSLLCQLFPDHWTRKSGLTFFWRWSMISRLPCTWRISQWCVATPMFFLMNFQVCPLSMIRF